MNDGQKQTINHIYHNLRDIADLKNAGDVQWNWYSKTLPRINHMLWYLEQKFPKDMLKHEMGDDHPLYPPNWSFSESEDE